MKPRLSLKGRALQLLAQREHSRVELRRKLAAHARAVQRESVFEGGGAEPAEEPVDTAAQVDAVLAWLDEHQFASDERFVESRVHARAARFGNLRIRSELAQHGVAVGAEQAQRLKDSEFERAWQVWQRRFGAAASVDSDSDAAADAGAEGRTAAQARQSRFLAGRGFTPEVIRQVLRHAQRAAAEG